MWRRKELKKRAKHSLKKHYWKFLVVCLIAAYMTGAYQQNGTMNLVVAYDFGQTDNQAIQSNIQDTHLDASQVIGKTVGHGDITQKYNRGVFADIFNKIVSSGSVLIGILNFINEGVFSGRFFDGFILLAGSFISFLLWFLILNIFKVCQSRLYLEGASYRTISLSRLLFLLQIKKWWHVSVVMFFKWLYTCLWSLTVVGGVIKFYSYRMIPYILAENPGISKKTAFELSRQMMRGNKWNTFVLDVSFIGWNAISILSGGLIGVFFVNPYITGVETELYLSLRQKALDCKSLYAEFLNDKYIGLRPMLPEGMTKLPETYPISGFSIKEVERRTWIKVEYRRNYSIWSLILLFFTFSLIGWLWEVSLHLSTDGFVNRGVLQGPWLPIYGSGGVLVLVLLKKVREHKICTFLLTVLICAVLEYGTSWFLEVTQGKKWWDYSGYLLNLNGRICAEGLLVFGFGGCAFIYFAAPLFDQIYSKIPIKRQMIICAVLLSIFFADALYSTKHPNEGKGITDYDKKVACIQEISFGKMKESIRNL